MTSTDLIQKSAHELHNLYKNKKASPLEVITQTFAQIKKHNPSINAFSFLDEESAMLEAKASEKRWSEGTPKSFLDGIPTTLKDHILVKGWPARRGSLTISEKVSEEDAPMTQHLKNAGTILVGKTTMCEFGWKGVTDNKVNGITRNPWDLSKTPGGSSGGAGAALRCGMGVLAVGSDAGGSIRIPAAFCGVFGLKPTLGLIPNYPLSAMENFATMGPMTHCVEDAAWLMDVIVRPHTHTTKPLPPFTEHYREMVNEEPLKLLKIAYSEDLGFVKMEPSIVEAFHRALDKLSQAGFILEPVNLNLEHYENFPEKFNVLWMAKAGLTLDLLPTNSHALLDPNFLKMALVGKEILLKDYLKADIIREGLMVRFNCFFTEYDFLLTPTMALSPFEVGLDSPNAKTKGNTVIENWVPFTSLFNMTQHPAASLPCGFDNKNLPVGLQIIGKHFSDGELLQFAKKVESILGPCPFPSWF